MISSIEDFISKIEFLEETDVYRGQPDIRFKLIPSIGRLPFKNPEEILYQYEKSIFDDFKRKAPFFLNEIPVNNYEWLILAQQYGLPTRLLDWTYNPLIALYFAVENDLEVDCSIYQAMLNRFITSELMGDQNPFDVNEPLGIIPTSSHERHHFQNGVFTITPKPYEEDFSFVMKRFIIPQNNKKSIRWKLRKLGITKALIFPQLDSLPYDILEMHKSKYDSYFKV